MGSGGPKFNCPARGCIGQRGRGAIAWGFGECEGLVESVGKYLAELWSHRVVRIGAAYAAAGWALFQVAINVGQTLAMPAWLAKLILVLLILGFPVTLILAWASQARPGPAVATPIRRGAVRTAGEAPSIAVLPFANFSREAADEVFADGMIEDLITSLSMNPGLRVISRTSTFAYKNQSPDVRAVAADLGCDLVLEGSVRRTGERLRVTAQLIDGATVSHVWANRYDRPVEALFDLQDELIRQIATALGDAVMEAEFDRLRRNPASVSAWEEAMRAFLALERPTIESARVALGHGRRSVALDPNFALGHARLGSACMTLGQLLGGDEGAALHREGAAAIDRALDLSPDDAKVLTVAAGQMGFYGRADEAIRHGLRARALNPHDSHTVGALANAYFGAGRYAEAARHYDEEAALSPRAVMVVSHSIVHGIARIMLGEYDQAEAVLRRSLELDPAIASTWAVLALLQLLRGRDAAAVEAIRSLRQMNSTITADQLAKGFKANIPHPDIDRLVAAFHQAWTAALAG